MHKTELIELTIKALRSSRIPLELQLKEIDDAINFQKTLLEDAPISKYIPALDKFNKPKIENKLGPYLIRQHLVTIFNEINQPIKLGDLQERFTNVTGSEIDIRDNLRSMQKSGVLMLLKINKSNRNSYWVMSSWVQDGILKEEFVGEFDKMYEQKEMTFS